MFTVIVIKLRGFVIATFNTMGEAEEWFGKATVTKGVDAIYLYSLNGDLKAGWSLDD